MTTTQSVDAIVAAASPLICAELKKNAWQCQKDLEKARRAFGGYPGLTDKLTDANEAIALFDALLAHMDGLKKDAQEAAAKEREACALACDKSAQWADDTAVRIRADMGVTREYVHHRLIKLVSRMNARAIRARTAAMAEGADR